MKRLLVVIFAIILSTSILICGNSQRQMSVMQAFDTYGNAIKMILNNSIYDVDVDSLLKNSIVGMISDLDPYSEYFTFDANNEMSIVSNGKYYGFGFGSNAIRSKMVIASIRDNSPAMNAGLRVGDIIYSIDSVVIEGYEQGNVLFSDRQQSNIKIIRPGIVDTLEFFLRKDTINVPSISISTILDGSIAYIKLEQFTANSYLEFREAFFAIIKQKEISGLIIDLRGNGGGVLQEAIKITNMFVPKGSTIVTTIDNIGEVVTFRALFQPIDTTIPIVVMIDEESASASELVAGCLQDLDRATITGGISFGKGLVQEMYEIAQTKLLKITTAKYYTPSGRCIQKIDYSKNKKWKNTSKKNSEQSSYSKSYVMIDTANIDNDHIFYTAKGRRVYEHDGIIPDIFISADTMTSKLAKELSNSFAIFDFINFYGNTYDSSELDLNEYTFYNKFVDFVCENNIIRAIKVLDSSIAVAVMPNESEILTYARNALIAEYRDYMLNDSATKSDIMKQINYTIKYKLLSEKEFNQWSLQNDAVVIKANKLFEIR